MALRVLDLAFVIALGAGLGLASAQLAVAERPWLGKVEVGPWTTWPRAGARDADPYMRAHLARGVHLPLGAGEGLELVAMRDEAGDALDSRCRYRIAGATPTARAWTLNLTDEAGEPLSVAPARHGFSDSEVVRDEDGSLAIIASAAPESGNWLPLPAGRRFRLVLRLYDTPVSSHANELRPATLPTVTRMDCR